MVGAKYQHLMSNVPRSWKNNKRPQHRTVRGVGRSWRPCTARCRASAPRRGTTPTPRSRSTIAYTSARPRTAAPRRAPWLRLQMAPTNLVADWAAPSRRGRAQPGTRASACPRTWVASASTASSPCSAPTCSTSTTPRSSSPSPK